MGETSAEASTRGNAVVDLRRTRIGLITATLNQIRDLNPHLRLSNPCGACGDEMKVECLDQFKAQSGAPVRLIDLLSYFITQWSVAAARCYCFL
jgi:hypothetical protein